MLVRHRNGVGKIQSTINSLSPSPFSSELRLHGSQAPVALAGQSYRPGWTNAQSKNWQLLSGVRIAALTLCACSLTTTPCHQLGKSSKTLLLGN